MPSASGTRSNQTSVSGLTSAGLSVVQARCSWCSLALIHTASMLVRSCCSEVSAVHTPTGVEMTAEFRARCMVDGPCHGTSLKSVLAPSVLVPS